MGERSAKGRGSFILVPVPIDERGKQAHRQRSSWWLLGIRWIQYHSIQLRWDIERFFARRFHRRWGEQ